MRHALAVLTTLALTGCPYMSKAQFDEYWDNDGDTYGVGEDCDDANEWVHPYAYDFRGDGCDADCGTEPDADGDDWPDGADCAPDDATIFPCAVELSETDGIDSDCDGRDTTRAGGCISTDPDADEANEVTPYMTRDCQYTPPATASSDTGR